MAQLVVRPQISISRLWVRVSHPPDFFDKAKNIPLFSGRLYLQAQSILRMQMCVCVYSGIWVLETYSLPDAFFKYFH